MKLSEIIAHVGDEHIKVQRLDASLQGAKEIKGGLTELRVVTDQINTTDVFRMTDGITPKMHGLIIWLPTDKLPKT